MKAIILAAGIGSRIRQLEPKKPKCLIEIGGVSILERLVNQLLKNKIKKIDIITGYKSHLIKKKFDKIANIKFYPNYKKTNNFSTLYYFKHLLNDETIISFADIILDDCIIKKLVKSNVAITAVVDTSTIRKDTMKVVIKKKTLDYIGKGQDSKASGNFIGILKIKKPKIKIFKSSMSKILKFNKKNYYTETLNDLISKKIMVNILNIKKYYWTEIDKASDYKKAKKDYKKCIKYY